MKNIKQLKRGKEYNLFYCEGCNSLLLQKIVCKTLVCGCDFKQKLKCNNKPIVYILKGKNVAEPITKIGITDAEVLDKRLSKINRASGITFEIYKIFTYKTRQTALSIEKFIKIKYKQHMLDKKSKKYGVTEMYYIDEKEIEDYIKLLNSTFSKYIV